MRKLLSVCLAFMLLMGIVMPVYATDKSKIEAAVIDTAEHVYSTVKTPHIGSVGGEWAVLGLARSGYDVPRSYYENYYKNVESLVRANQGLLEEGKYTEYSRIILGLTAAGFDPRNVGGYDLTMALGDFDKTVRQGINGPVFALIALDSAGYEIPKNPEAATQATREMYIGEILKRQLSDGGFALNKLDTTADADITGMVLQALAKYQDRAEVKAATGRALACLSNMQGELASGEAESAESVVQVIVALCEIGVDVNDPGFIKNGNSLLDRLMEYYVPGKGFERTIEGGVNQMSTEQALYALTAVYRLENGLTSLYDMTDVGIIPVSELSAGRGLPGKHDDVHIRPITAQGRTFSDIAGHGHQQAIEALAERGILNGKSERQFDPDAAMTRAELAAIVTRSLGLAQSPGDTFSDVPPSAWYAGYIGAASKYGIVSGTSAAIFNPNGIIMREEAAAMVARTAKLCGMDTALDAVAVRNVLAQFGDYLTVSPWTIESMAFCYGEDILSQDVFEIKPQEAVTRGELAEMLYRVLLKAGLL